MSRDDAGKLQLTEEERQQVMFEEQADRNLAHRMIRSLLEAGFDFSEVRWFANTAQKYSLAVTEMAADFMNEREEDRQVAPL